MPRVRLSPLMKRRERSVSCPQKDSNPQSESEMKHINRREKEEDSISRSTMESDICSENRITDEIFQQKIVQSLLSNCRKDVTNNSVEASEMDSTAAPTSTPKSGRLSPRPNFVDSGYIEAEKSITSHGKSSQTTETLTGPATKRDTNQFHREELNFGTVPNAITKVRSNSSRLDTLAHSKARLLVLNDNLTLRSLKADEDIGEILGLSHNAGKGITVEELLENFGRVPMDKIHHFAMVGEYIRDLHLESKMVDVLIHVGGQTFAAHRVALACHSKYFANMFAGHDDKAQLPVELTLSGMGPVAFQAFLRYVYTGEIIVSPESIGDVLSVSEKLNIPEIREMCSEYIQTISSDQAMGILASKMTSRGSKIFKYAYNLVVDNFCNVFDVDFFLKLSLDLVCILLSDDMLYVNTEMDVFWAALKWVAYHITERHNYVARIMKCVRFPLLSKRELLQCLEVTDLLRKSPACRDMILSAILIITANEMGRPDPLNLPRPEPRLCMRDDYVPKREEEIYEEDLGVPEDDGGRLLPLDAVRTSDEYLGGAGSADTMGSMMMGSPAVNVSESRMQTRSPGDILAIGGFHKTDKDSHLKDVERYSTNERQWKYYTGLPEPRQQHAVSMLDGKLYLVGGTDPVKKFMKHSSALHTSFMFDPAHGSWTKIGPLVTARMNHALCTLGGLLYAIGGQDDRNRVLSSVECYNPSTNTWQPVKNMNTARCGFGACVCDGRIFVAGGKAAASDKRSNMPVLDKFECYDPKFNVWADLSPLTTGRCLCNLVCVGNSIYLCGGAARDSIKDDLRSLATIDVYDINTDAWQYKTDLIKPRHNAGATVIGTKIYMIGGMSTVDNQTLQSIECYDTRTECWDTSIQDLPYPAKWLGCVAIPISK